jgi:thiol-disulfide isomerase/thioredoxin
MLPASLQGMSMRPHRSAWQAMACVLLLLPALGLAAVSPRPKAGELPPDVLGMDLDGEPVSVSQHRGKVVIVTFWASWCGPCRRELPMLAHIQKTVGREHLEVIAVNYKEHRKDFLEVIRANRDVLLTYVHDKGPVSDRYGVTTLPNMFIIDREGRIAHTHIGYGEETFRQMIEEIIALLPPEATARPAKS